MSEAAKIYQGIKAIRRAERAAFGQPCPECVAKLPRANPSILLPQQVCRIHRCRDPRPELTDSDYIAAGLQAVAHG